MIVLFLDDIIVYTLPFTFILNTLRYILNQIETDNQWDNESHYGRHLTLEVYNFIMLLLRFQSPFYNNSFDL